MTRGIRLWSLLLVAACSGLDEGDGGVVAVEVEIPEVTTIEVGQQVQVVARALDLNGAVVDVPLEWQASTAAVTVDGTGLVTGVEPGEADVQAFSGNLPSEPVPFDVFARVDTVIIVSAAVDTLPIVEPPPVAALTVQLQTFSPAGPVSGGSVIFEITSPAAGPPAVVQLTDGVQSATVTTAADGNATIEIGAVPGEVPPDTAIVQVRAERLGGEAVPGSGQQFIILFQ